MRNHAYKWETANSLYEMCLQWIKVVVFTILDLILFCFDGQNYHDTLSAHLIERTGHCLMLYLSMNTPQQMMPGLQL